jgi:hypothetical protein
MTELEFSVEVAAQADRVFVFFIPQRMPYWYGAEMDAHFEVEGGRAEFRVGDKVHIRARLGRREVSITTVVTRYERGRLLEWQFHDAHGVRGMQRWELEPTATGTIVKMSDHFKLPGRFGWLVERLITRRAAALRGKHWLARLKQLAEGRRE